MFPDPPVPASGDTEGLMPAPPPDPPGPPFCGLALLPPPPPADVIVEKLDGVPVPPSPGL